MREKLRQLDDNMNDLLAESEDDDEGSYVKKTIARMSNVQGSDDESSSSKMSSHHSMTSHAPSRQSRVEITISEKNSEPDSEGNDAAGNAKKDGEADGKASTVND